MNHRPADLAPPSRAKAEEALTLLARWAAAATPDERRGLMDLLPRAALARDYDAGFAVDAAYRASLPDIQNQPAASIRGAQVPLAQVGIDGFRLPMRVAVADGERAVEARITGTVALSGEAKGINMSRIMRSFYANASDRLDWDLMDAVLDDYRASMATEAATLKAGFSLPLEQPSLRSGLAGWQYYDAVLEVRDAGGVRTRILHVDYVYSSTCPCSLELAEHARAVRGRLATPHSQRSVARLTAVVDTARVDEVVAMCRRQIPTETQVMVKREDEQAFAELNAANPIFVEDAARLLSEGLTAMGAPDHRVTAVHAESLHSHDAVAVLTCGGTFPAEADPGAFAALAR